MRLPRVLVTMTLTVLAAVALASPAGAQDAVLAMDQPVDSTRTRESLRIAEGFFGMPVPCGRVRVYRADLGVGSAGTVVGATSRQDLCAIWLDDGYEPAGWRGRVRGCTILVHEYGHLLGLHHVVDPRSVMHEHPTFVTVRGCYRRFRPLPARPRALSLWAREWAS